MINIDYTDILRTTNIRLTCIKSKKGIDQFWLTARQK